VVENRGHAVLLSAGPYPVHIAYRWFQQIDGQVVPVLEGVRSGLDGGLTHQQSTKCVLEVAAPEQEGQFILSITLVQEHVAWFDDLAPDNACCHPVRVSTASPLDLLKEEIRQMAACERGMRMDLHRERAAARVVSQLGSTITKQREYGELIGDLREIVHAIVPAGSTVMVVNRGDARLLNFDDREGWHFPQDPSGTYAGFYPADSEAAISHLETLRAHGGKFLVFPSTASWWLEHYEGLRVHLETHYRRAWSDRCCVIYDLGEAAASSAPGERENGRRYIGTPSIDPSAPTILSDWEHARRSFGGSADGPSYVWSA